MNNLTNKSVILLLCNQLQFRVRGVVHFNLREFSFFKGIFGLGVEDY